jgi:hypothetical protein
MDTRIYKSDPLDRLNINFQDFQDKLVQLAYQAPGEYNQIRRVIRKSIMNDIVIYIHSLVTNTLTSGRKTRADGSAGVAIVDTADGSTPNVGSIFGVDFKPQYSNEMVDKVAMNLSATVQSAIEKHILDVIMPPDIFAKTLERAGRKSALNDRPAPVAEP